MSREAGLLAAARRDRGAFDSINRYCEDSDFSPIGKAVMQAIRQYYKRDSSAYSINKDILLRSIEATLHNPTQLELVEHILDSDGSESIPNILVDLLDFKLTSTGMAVSEALMKNNRDKALVLMQQYQQYAVGLDEGNPNKASTTHIGLDFDELTSSAMLKPEFPIMPKSLNTALNGGVWRQSHIGLVARPEIGKSLISINISAGLLRRNVKCLYFGNEDSSKSMRLRFVSNLSNMTKFEIMENPEQAFALANKRGLGNLIFVESPRGSIGLLNELSTEHRQDFLVIDQLRNLEDGGAGGMTQVLETCGRGARELAKRHNMAVLSVTQAGESGAGKACLEPEDVEYSKTGFHATLDLLIGVGANKSMLANNLRMIKLSKNKISTTLAAFAVEVDPAKSRVRSVD